MNYIYSDCLTALDNMMLDSYLIQKSDKEYFRLYKWNKSTLSLGVTNHEIEINIQYIKENDIDIVRRETGGGIVLHGEDLCFSFITNIVLKPKDNYMQVKKHFENILLNLNKHVTKTSNRNTKSSICFNGSNNHEISVNNKKVIGISQKVIKNRYLIQGSIQLKTTSVEAFLFIDSTSNIQNGLDNLKYFTVKGKIYNYFNKIFRMKNINDSKIINSVDYAEFKQKNLNRFNIKEI